MLTLCCLKPPQAPHPISDKIQTFQLSLQDLCGQDSALSSNTFFPIVLLLCSRHSAPSFCDWKLLNTLATGPLHLQFALPGCPLLLVLFPVWWFPKCGPWTSSSSVAWELIRNGNSWTSSRSGESETLGEFWAPSNVFNQPSR